MKRAALLLALGFALGTVGLSLAAEPRPFLRGTWQELRQQHRGQPVIVHFWGLTCAPCLAEMPEWGRFARDIGAGVVVMVAADPVNVEPRDLERMLTKAGLGEIESWRFAESFAERLQFEIDPGWQGELPFTMLLGSDDTSKAFLGSADFVALRTWLKAQTR